MGLYVRETEKNHEICTYCSMGNGNYYIVVCRYYFSDQFIIKFINPIIYRKKQSFYKGRRIEALGYKVHAIETTGAGDNFCGTSIAYLLDHGIEDLSDEQLKEMLTKANAAEALITTRKGVIRSMPEIQEIDNLIKEQTI